MAAEPRVSSSTATPTQILMIRSLTVLTLATFTACTGDGSDIGPDIPRLAGSTYQILVRANSESGTTSVGVSSATVSVAGLSETATTNRAGRADIRAIPAGVRNLTIDASNASATAGDRLAGYTVSVDTPGTAQAPYVIFLPDLAASATTTLNAGTQSGLIHNDTSSSGAILTIGSGSVVDLGGSSSVTLRTGQLSADNLPGLLSPPPGQTWLTTRGVFIAPGTLTCSPGATLALPNDFNFPPATAVELWRLDASTGTWAKASDAVVDGGGTRVSSAGGVTTGGLYTFAAAVSSSVVISGVVTDRSDRGVPGVLVRTGQAYTRTLDNGSFQLDAVAAVDGQNAQRTISVALHGGRDLYPNRSTLSVVASASTVDVGRVQLDTAPVTLYRGLLIERGRARPLRHVRLTSSERGTSHVGFAGPDARFDFEDVEIGGRLSFISTYLDPREPNRVLSAESRELVNAGQRILDRRWFFDDQEWITNINGDSAAYVLDKRGHGIVEGAAVIRDPGDGVDRLWGTISLGRFPRLDFGDLNGEAIASASTEFDGRRVHSAFSTRRARTSRTELALERANRASLGAFPRFGLVNGSLTALGTQRRIHATPRLDREVWLDATLGGEDIVATLPKVLDPQTAGGVDFVAGVPSAGGNLVGLAGTVSGADYRMEHLWIARGLTPTAGAREPVSLGAGLTAGTTFTVTDGLVGLAASIGFSNLICDYGIEFGTTRSEVVEVLRGNTGSLLNAGQHLAINLPTLTGDLAGAKHLLAVRGESTVSNVTTEQRTFAVLDGATIPTVPFLTPPSITSPSPNGFVPATGFEVQFTVPTGAAYSLVKLRQEVVESGVNVVRDWTALVPPDQTSFRFRTLPDGATSPLIAGTYTLSVTAARISSGRLTELDFPYERIASRWIGISLAEREVDALSKTSITVVLQ